MLRRETEEQGVGPERLALEGAHQLDEPAVGEVVAFEAREPRRERRVHPEVGPLEPQADAMQGHGQLGTVGADALPEGPRVLEPAVSLYEGQEPFPERP